MSGLAPTLIIARVAQNNSMENVEQVMSTLHFNDRQSHVGSSDAEEGGSSQHSANDGVAGVSTIDAKRPGHL
ncbi:hypothetical protein AAF712_007409 [Marasmius tenuissimus]|uniref:Uncharacterized protein n=1 Tax=Marasmius tenuissimus TaxID=585030 RepID=A0ABR2ZV76_9AGAR